MEKKEKVENILIQIVLWIGIIIGNIVIDAFLFHLCGIINLGELETVILTFIGCGVFAVLSINSGNKLLKKLKDRQE